MEERGLPHRLTQRRLGDPEETPDPPESEGSGGEPERETPAELPDIPAPPASVAVPRYQEPSDVELRKRQRAWREERARFEAAKESRTSADAPTKGT
ncbi:MAG: hypothetical protein ACRECT_01450 [Thermoplasmata archaeon]